MRPLLRFLTVASFATFLVAATLAFSVRVSAAPNDSDAGVDAGALSVIFGHGLEPQGFASSKSFGGSSLSPNGFGLGLRGGAGDSSGLGELGGRPATLRELSVVGALPPVPAEQKVRGALGIHFGQELCVTGRGEAQAVIEVAAGGAVRSVRWSAPGLVGRSTGLGCLGDRLRGTVFPAAKGPSTITVKLWLGAPLLDGG